MPCTDHSEDIADLRTEADVVAAAGSDALRVLALRVAADLLEIHDDTGLSLDNWPDARALVEHLIDGEIQENGV